MICLVFNGYYRSGTTIMWWIMRESNPNMLHIYEPLSPDVSLDVSGNLHGISIGKAIVEEYKRLPKLEEFRKIREKTNFTLPFDLNQVKGVMDFLHDLDIPVIVQPNNFHFILRDISKKYGCKVIHIIRNPVDTWIASTCLDPATTHLLTPKTMIFYKLAWIGLKVIPKASLNILAMSRINKGYYLEEEFESICNHFKYDKNLVRDFLDKRLTVWSFCNYIAWKQIKSCKHGMIVYYEDIVKDPRYWFEEMENFSGVKFSDVREIKSYICSLERLKETFIERLKTLKLYTIVKQFYPPDKWF